MSNASSFLKKVASRLPLEQYWSNYCLNYHNYRSISMAIELNPSYYNWCSSIIGSDYTVKVFFEQWIFINAKCKYDRFSMNFFQTWQAHLFLFLQFIFFASLSAINYFFLRTSFSSRSDRAKLQWVNIRSLISSFWSIV